ncbi:MAG: pyridoxamine 5'-phosphate oxidase [Actinomycetota bacterium]
MPGNSLGDMRVDYSSAPLDLADLDPDPLIQFERWLSTAMEAAIEEPNAFVLATVDDRQRPSARAVLLKAVGPEGFTFYTNYQSRKAAELAARPFASAVFVWIPLHRQVRIEGRVVMADPATSDAYFAARPPEARLAAAASPQSQVVANREELDRRLEEIRLRHPDGNVPRPDHWGGYVLTPDYYEFWQGREARFHDRFRYTPDEEGWRIERLAP